MNNDVFTSEQEDQLKKWKSERDVILSENYLKKTENESLTSLNKDLSDSVKKLTEEKNLLEKTVEEKTAFICDIARYKTENNQLLEIQQQLNQEIFTLEEQQQLKSWAGKRDSVLAELASLNEEKKQLEDSVINLAKSYTDISDNIKFSEGRISELKIKETELLSVVSRDAASLQSKKSTLEAEVASLNKIVEILTSQKTSLEADVSFALSTFDVIKGETLLLDKVVDRVTSVSQDNTAKIDLLVNNLAVSLEEIIAVNRKNVFETNIVINKVPAMIMEAQKHGLIKNKI